jgi:hypothetical protein
LLALTFNMSESCFFTFGLVWFILLLTIVRAPNHLRRSIGTAGALDLSETRQATNQAAAG